MTNKLKKANILLIGPLPNLPLHKIGGARVSFKFLIDHLKKIHWPFQVINTKPFEKGWKTILNPFYILIHLLSKMRNCDVIFLNVSQGGTKKLAPIVYLFCRLFHKKMVFRPFGGGLKEDYQNYTAFQNWIFHKTVLKADLIFLQTQELMSFFKELGGNIQQFPTSRTEPDPGLLQREKTFNKRFVYIGHIKPSKGIDHLLEAQSQLDDSYTLHMYGPLFKAYETLPQKKNTPYQGLLDKDEVLDKLRKYNVLILPTFFKGEGYPGSIIEAYSLGIPVIATNWKAIPEIVQDGKTGRLIQVHSTSDLVKAIRSFNEKNYLQLTKNARESFKNSFCTEVVITKALKEIQKLF